PARRRPPVTPPTCRSIRSPAPTPASSRATRNTPATFSPDTPAGHPGSSAGHPASPGAPIRGVRGCRAVVACLGLGPAGWPTGAPPDLIRQDPAREAAPPDLVREDPARGMGLPGPAPPGPAAA